MRYVNARAKMEQRNLAYRIYVTDALKATTNNLARGGSEAMVMSARWYDLIDPAPPEEPDNRSTMEIVDDIWAGIRGEKKVK